MLFTEQRTLIFKTLSLSLVDPLVNLQRDRR